MNTKINESKVFGIGLSRTGTSSLTKLLEYNGLRTNHYSKELFVNGRKLSSQLEFKPQLKYNLLQKYKLNRVRASMLAFNVDKFLDNYQAFTDNPIPIFYKVLDKKYPKSKFICTIRDKYEWLESMEWLLKQGGALWRWNYIDYELIYKTYGTIRYNKSQLLNAFEAHNEDVFNYFRNRQDDLYILKIEDLITARNDLYEFLKIKNPRPGDIPLANQKKKVSSKKRLAHNFFYHIPINCND